MTEQSRRAFLAAGVSGLAAVAGCSNLPWSGGETDTPDYDSARLRPLPEAVEIPETYPGAVPDALATNHRERARALLDEVPVDPSFPNGAVTTRLARERSEAADQVAETDVGAATLGGLGDWQYARQSAAEVWGAHDAAAGESSRRWFRDWRRDVRADLQDFESDWAHRGPDVETALLAHREFELMVENCRTYLVTRRSFPADPKADVFAAGELVADVERARAELADVVGLRDRFTESGMPTYRDQLATAGSMLEQTVRATREPVSPYFAEDAGIDDFERDVGDTPAADLFRAASRMAYGATDYVADSLDEQNYATAVVAGGNALVELLALSTAVDAIEAGDYGVPESTDAVVEHRESALDALERAEGVEPTAVAQAVGRPVWRAFRDAEQRLGARYESQREDVPDSTDVMHAVGNYALTVHAARAVPAVVERVTQALDEATAD